MLLDDDLFFKVIAASPLVSIDLIVRNERNEVLLGMRTNRPAMGFWFVPGGRIRKDEPSLRALARIAQDELGISIPKSKLFGVFDHFYDDNVFAIPHVRTHYVAIGYELEICGSTPIRSDSQHARFKWWTLDMLLASAEVHENTKLYFSHPTAPAVQLQEH